MKGRSFFPGTVQCSSNSCGFVQVGLIFRYHCSFYLHLSFSAGAVHPEDTPWSPLRLLNKRKEECTSVAPWSTLNMTFLVCERYGGLATCFISHKTRLICPLTSGNTGQFLFPEKKKSSVKPKDWLQEVLAWMTVLLSNRKYSTVS